MNSATRMQPHMTHGQVAQLLGIGASFLSKVVRAGVVTPTRFGDLPVYSDDDLEALRAYLDTPRRGRRSDAFRAFGAEPADAYLSVPDAANMLGVSSRTVHRWIELGRLACYRTDATPAALLRRDVEAQIRQNRPEPL